MELQRGNCILSLTSFLYLQKRRHNVTAYFLYLLPSKRSEMEGSQNCVLIIFLCHLHKSWSPESWIGYEPIQLYGGFHRCLPNQTSCSIFPSFISKHVFIPCFYVFINQAKINVNKYMFKYKIYLDIYWPDVMVDVEGDYGPEDDDGRQRHQVGDIPHDELLQMLTVGDLARVKLLKHCRQS